MLGSVFEVGVYSLHSYSLRINFFTQFLLFPMQLMLKILIPMLVVVSRKFLCLKLEMNYFI